MIKALLFIINIHHHPSYLPSDIMQLLLPFSMLLTAGRAIAFSPQDAIHPDDVPTYSEFMGKVQDSQFLDMFLEGGTIQVNVYNSLTNSLDKNESFRPSSMAEEYFEHEKAVANQLLDPSDTGGGISKRELCGPGPFDGKMVRSLQHLEERRSNCYQFCGSINHCRGNNGCPHCYSVRQGCLWQKWCR